MCCGHCRLVGAGIDQKGTSVDSVTHPDLVALGRVLRDRMDRTLDAEMEAARAAARRRRTLRDVALEAEDRRSEVLVTTTDGAVHHGVIRAVGADYLDLDDGGSIAVVLDHVVSLVIRP